LSLSIYRLHGLTPYWPCYQAMRAFTRQRTAHTSDELWLVEHAPIYTLGQAGREAHLLNTGAIPVVRTDRGGQVTFHGPGQLVVYPLLAYHHGVKTLVHGLEQSVVDLLAEFGLDGQRRDNAPGVYIAGRKIASLGLRVQRQGCYHGLALNVTTDLTAFEGIEPCGYPGLSMTRLQDWVTSICLEECAKRLLPHLARCLALPVLDYSWQSIEPSVLFSRFPTVS